MTFVATRHVYWALSASKCICGRGCAMNPLGSLQHSPSLIQLE